MRNDQNHMQPLDPQVHYGITDRSYLDTHPVQMDLLPDQLHQLRWKLNQKAKREPKFRFYTLYDRVYRMDVLEAAWKHVGQKGKASGIDGVRAEDILAEENGEKKFLTNLHEEFKTKSYHPSTVKRVYIPKADGSKRPLGIPTLKDRVAQMAVQLIIEPIFEADGCVRPSSRPTNKPANRSPQRKVKEKTHHKEELYPHC